MRIVFCVISITFLFTACSKDKGDDPIVGGDAKLVFTIAGVDSQNEINLKLGNVGAESLTKSNAAEVSTKELGHGIMLQTIAERGSMESILGNDLSGKSNIKQKLASTSPLETGKTYRILVFNRATNQLERNIVARSGTSTEIPVHKNQMYYWYAFSYNDTDPNPAFDLTNMTIQSSIDRDLLYAKSSADITTNQPLDPIAIAFTHKVAMLSIEMNASSLGGDVHLVEGKLAQNNYLKTAKIDLTTGNIQGTVTTSTSDQLSFAADPNNPRVVVAQKYTVDPSNLSTVSVQVEKLEVTPYSTNIRVDLAGTPGATPNPITFNFPTTPPLVVGDKLTGALYLSSPLPQLTILHAGYNDYTGRVGIPWNIVPHANIARWGSEDENDARTWLGFSGYLRHHFRLIAGHSTIDNYRYFGYESNKRFVELREPFVHKVGTDLINQIPENPSAATPDPDIVILSNWDISFSAADIQRLKEYVLRKGVVIMMAERGKYVKDAGQIWRDESTSHQTLLPFIQDVFGSPNASLHSIGYGSIRPIFKLNTTINDQITNGFYGDMRNKYWAGYIFNNRPRLGGGNGSTIEPGANLMFVSNLNPAAIYDYSPGYSTENLVNPYSPIGNYPSGSTINSNSSIIFRSKNHNVIFIGEADFADGASIDGSGYYSFESGEQGYYSMKPSYDGLDNPNPNINNYAPMTVSSISSTGFAVDNAKIMGNMIVWGLIEAAYRGANSN